MKTIFALLLVGFAAARSKLMAYTNEDTPRIITGDNGIFDISYTYSFEATYGTAFSAEVDADDSDIYHDAYSFNFDASMSTAFTFDVAGLFTHKIEVDVTLLDVTPYRQIISYVNPAALLAGTKTTFDIGASGEYDLYFGEISTSSTQGVMTITKSIADYLVSVFSGATDATLIAPSFADFEISESDSYTESYLGFTFAEEFGFDSSSWYGTQELWTASIFGTI